MPAPYSSVFPAFFRQGFAKSFTQGYAQSVVAATHPHLLNAQNRPAFARRNSNRFSRHHALQLQSAFHTERTGSYGGLAEHRHDRSISHGCLDAYFEALHNRQAAGDEVDKEWSQYQFPKRIEWKPTSAAVVGHAEAQTAAGGLVAAQGAEEDGLTPPAQDQDQASLSQIDAASAAELAAQEDVAPAPDAVAAPSLVSSSAQNVSAAPSRVATPSAERAPTPASSIRSASPPIDSQSQTYADHLTNLSEAQRYAEIPAVFEAMLVAGVTPIAAAYNALLLAAINLPTERIEILSKVLDVYADMLRRRIDPDSRTYDILVSLLATRSLEVFQVKAQLEEKRLRFGGMDEPGKFMFASTELEHAILGEEDRLDLAVKLFDSSVASRKAAYASETYHSLITACAQAGRVSDMLRLFEHLEASQRVPYAATFPAMITSFASSGDLVSAVECYNEYRALAIGNDQGSQTLYERNDARVYAAVINAYIVCDKLPGAMAFYEKTVREYGVRMADIRDAIVSLGFVNGFVQKGIFDEALRWAQSVEDQAESQRTLSSIATSAADGGQGAVATAAFDAISPHYPGIAKPAMALLALSVREGSVTNASRYWQILSGPDMHVNESFIEPTAMYAVALIGSGQVSEGLAQAEAMFQRIRATSMDGRPQLGDEIDEGVEFISRFMAARAISDPREVSSEASAPQQSTANSPYSSTPTVSSLDESFDPYAHNTDFKGSSLISHDLVEGAHGRKGPRLQEALARFRSMRRAGRHPRYITYAKLISAAAREGKMHLCRDILATARTDVPLLPHYPVVRYGWSSILDAMVGACLSTGDRLTAEQFHQELLDMGATPSANTYGLYITTLKESTRPLDEASEAVKIFHRAKAEGVEPTSFLYNALIGKLGKARRIDDCLFYFAEMRGLGIEPTSVTYGTIVNALCRVSDEKTAEELFDEMEAMPNYKARPAPYNSMMQFFLTTKRDKAKVLAYYGRMKAMGIAPTAHTFKLLVDAHATLEPVDMTAAEEVLEQIRAAGERPEPVHYASLIHARGCVLHDMEGARKVFDSVMARRLVPANACLFQALFEAMVANHQVAATEPLLGEMKRRGVEMTPYIANTLIHGWAAEKKIGRAEDIYEAVGRSRREPSTYEAMTRAYLSVEQREKAKMVVSEMVGRGYPSAVVNKVLELLGGGAIEA